MRVTLQTQIVPAQEDRCYGGDSTQCCAEWTVILSSVERREENNERNFPEEPWRVCRTLLTEKAAQARA